MALSFYIIHFILYHIHSISFILFSIIGIEKILFMIVVVSIFVLKKQKFSNQINHFIYASLEQKKPG